MKRFCTEVLLGLVAASPALVAQTLVDLRTQSKSVDFSAATSTKPFQTGAVLPSTCSVGATYFNTAAPPGKNLYGCTAANTWTLLGSSLLFGGGTVNAGDCAQFNSAGSIVDAGGACGAPTAVTMANPFGAAGSLLVSGGPGRSGVASSCTNNGSTLACPGGFAGYVTWPAGTGTNTRQILGPTGPLTTSFSYMWADAVPTGATLMKIGAPASGASSLGPAIPDTDYVTPSGTGALQNKSFDGTNVFSSYLSWSQITAPSVPALGYLKVYAKTGGGLCWMNSSGTETCGGTGLNDPGSSGLVAETSPGVTANRTLVAGSSNITVINGSGAGGNPSIDIGASVNFSAKVTTPVQVGASAGMPGTCTVGQLYFATDGVPGRQLETCAAANTWVPVAYGQGAVNPATCSVGQAYFNTSVPAGQNLYLCTAINAWTQATGTITSIFGRTGAVTAQTGDYTYAQIANTPAALPPNGPAMGDLAGSYPNPVVAQINGAAVPSSGILKGSANHQLILATAGVDYMGTTTPLQASQMPALSGDCFTSQGAVTTTCSKTNGTPFATSATTDTTNAANISSGTLSAARLPSTAMQTNQSNTVSGGTQDFRAAAHTLPMVTGLSGSLPSTCTVGEVYFATNTAPGQNQFYCTGTNNWTQQTGAVMSVFGRLGAVAAQTGDYTYSQIANTPTALPPTGAASGDLSGTYPSPKVVQINGAVVPTSGVLKGNASGQLVMAAAGTDYEAPITFTGALSQAGNVVSCVGASGTTTGCLGNADWTTFNNKQDALTNPVTGTGIGGAVAKFTGANTVGSATASDVINLFTGCSGTQYLGADGACHTGSGGSGFVTLLTGAGAPTANCSAPSSTNLALYLDTTNSDEWWCAAANTWKKTLSVTGVGPYQTTGATGTMPNTPASGMVTCYFDSTLNTQICLDSAGNPWQMVKETTLTDVQKRSCDITVGDASSSTAVANAQLGPQKHGCKIVSSGSVLEVDLESDAGSPSVIVGRRRCTAWASGTCSAESNVNLVSSATAASSGYMGCSNVGGNTGLDGSTTCAATLQNTALNAGDWIELVSGTAGGTAKLVTVHVIYMVQ
ncbi:MAG TPA: hypothetical protein VMB03_32680 [Bryobacteraceae bacterium]|nr:hypothetical protein [Bryobacteraceae bacterium]